MQLDPVPSGDASPPTSSSASSLQVSINTYSTVILFIVCNIAHYHTIITAATGSCSGQYKENDKFDRRVFEILNTNATKGCR